MRESGTPIGGQRQGCDNLQEFDKNFPISLKVAAPINAKNQCVTDK
jgi:hypothetical protein